MTDTNDELRKRILEDEPFELSKDNDLKAALVKRFENKRKKIMLYAIIALIMSLAIFFGGAYLLRQTTDMKLMLLAVVVMLIGFENTILIKLWYWVVDTYIRMVKEIKRLQLLTLEQSCSPDEMPLSIEMDISDKATHWDRVSVKTFGRLTSLVLVTVSVAGAIVFLCPFFTDEYTHKCEEHIIVAEDGSCTSTSRQIFTWHGKTPLTSFDMHGIPHGSLLSELTWHDGEGNVLPVEVHKKKDTFDYTVHYPRPYFNGEQVELRATNTVLGASVNKKDDLWVFNIHRTIGGPGMRRDLKQLVTLPPGAEIVSADPEPKSQWQEYKEKRWVLYFEFFKKDGASDKLRITYRLPEGEAK